LKEFLYSIVIPVYNSEEIISSTVEQVSIELNKHDLSFEIILVNDCSPDNSWEILKQIQAKHPKVKAINLLKNYGQHSAVICGIRESSGDYVVTMDDDLQNPPSEIIKLIEKVNEGYDLVFAKFYQKQHSNFRKLGTRIIDYFNKKIFNKPDNISLTNFRIFNRTVAQRAIAYRTNYPYIPGLLLMHANNIGNVYTEHHSRKIGSSNYSLIKIISLVSRLLFNYSSYPLRVISIMGLSSALMSFSYGVYVFLKAVFLDSAVPGWTSIVVLLSFFNGILILMLGILGVYISRILQQLSTNAPYHIVEILDSSSNK